MEDLNLEGGSHERIKLGKTNVDKGRKKCNGCLVEMARWPLENSALEGLVTPLGPPGCKGSGEKLGLELDLVCSSRGLQSSS